jgi:hypothetical protein
MDGDGGLDGVLLMSIGDTGTGEKKMGEDG